MAITENWNIRSRAHACAHTGNPFTQGESFYTALFDDPATGDLIRRDFSLAAWDEARALAEPFSFWKSTYEPPVNDAKPEVVEKENAESLLRRLIEENSPGSENTRYILAVMLERKKILKHTATRDSDDASFLIYEHPKSGEIYIIRDPELKLDQVEAVQREVSLLLTLGARPPQESTPEAAPTPDPTPDPTPEPESSSEPTPETEPTTEPTTEPVPETDPIPDPEPTTEPVPDPEPSSELAPETSAEPEPAPDSPDSPDSPA
jgi:hypothetical protein